MSNIRTCVVDDSIKSYFDSLVAQRCSFEIGLLVGNCSQSSTLDSVFVATAIPHEEVERPPNSLQAVSTEWISTYSQQISRMLPGGVSIVGTYIVAAQNNSSDIVSATHTHTRAALKSRINDGKPTYSIHLCPKSNKFTCKSFSGLIGNPAELKWHASHKLTSYLSYITVNLSFTIPQSLEKHQSKTKSEHLRQLSANGKRMKGAIQQHCENASHAIGVVTNRKINDMREVKLFSRVESPVRSLDKDELAVSLVGSVCSVVFINDKDRDNNDTIIQTIKDDYRKSLFDRIDILLEEWEQQIDLDFEEGRNDITIPMTQQEVIYLPRRATFIWPRTGSDVAFMPMTYILPGENISEAIERIEDLLSIKDSGDDDMRLYYIEEPGSSTTESVKSDLSQKKSGKPEKQHGIALLMGLVAVFIALIAVFLTKNTV